MMREQLEQFRAALAMLSETTLAAARIAKETAHLQDLLGARS